MKKLTLLLLLIITFAAANGQVKQTYPQYGSIWKRLQPDSAFKLPMSIVGIRDANAGLDTGQVRYSKPDSSVKVYTGSQWLTIGSSSATRFGYSGEDVTATANRTFSVGGYNFTINNAAQLELSAGSSGNVVLAVSSGSMATFQHRQGQPLPLWW